eukprot:gb/GEZN01003398.1/.p1 GENE.gb/GEZN01003398.1/~~gb/GEZN01003398.1/.p1  ORF type:complete len:727 (+),score=69.00 gb/GEZN01003398.1/:1-2181(+)
MQLGGRSSVLVRLPRASPYSLSVFSRKAASLQGDASPSQRMRELSQRIKASSQVYYGGQREAPTSDEQFDSWTKELRSLEEKHPHLAEPDSPTTTVGAAPRGFGLQHNFPMLSLNSGNGHEELCAHASSVLRLWASASKQNQVLLAPSWLRFFPGPLHYMAELKYDGMAISLTYRQGKLARALSRGDGFRGEDVLPNLQVLTTNIPHLLSFDKVPDLKGYDIEVRGELVLAKSDFSQYNRTQATFSAAGFEQNPSPSGKSRVSFRSPRNLCAGLLNRDLGKGDDISTLPRLTFVAYSLHFEIDRLVEEYCKGFKIDRLREAWKGSAKDLLHLEGHHYRAYDTQSSRLKLLKQIGFFTDPEAMPFSSLSPNPDAVDEWAQSAMEWIEKISVRREELPFEVDGIVLKLDSISAQHLLGSTSHHPRWAQALKFAAKEAVTTLKDVYFQVGRTGRLVPVAEFNTVSMGGASVSRATLHNFDHLSKLQLRIGSTVLLERSGDVVPRIVRVLETGTGASITTPLECPCALHRPLELRTPTRKQQSVSGPLIEDLYCAALDCPQQALGRLTHACSTSALRIPGLGVATLTQLREAGLLSDLPELFSCLRAVDSSAKEALLARLGKGWGEQRLGTLQAALDHARRDCSPAQVLSALGLPRVGLAKAKSLLKSLGSFEAVIGASQDQLQGLAGFAEKSVSELHAALAHHKKKTLVQWRKDGVQVLQQLDLAEPPT